MLTDLSGNKTKVYLFSGEQQRSITLLLKNSPEFTAKIVDRWQELEGQKNQTANATSKLCSAFCNWSRPKLGNLGGQQKPSS